MSTTATTKIDITAKDSTAAAFNSAERNLSSLASSALKTTAGLAGIGLSIAGAVEAVRGIAQATIQYQQFTSTLQVGTGSAKAAGEALEFVRAESHRLGLDLATSADQFAKLTAASKGTALEGKATRDIFSSMSEAATVLGLSADQTRGALNAFQQMISKGKVQAEELRGQLGERLPGAFSLAARAMGVTTAELDKLLVAGKVTAEELLPKLAAELNKTFGPQAEQSAKSLSSQINRMNTAMFDLKIAIGETGLINFLSSGIELATKLANAMTGAFGGGRKLSAIDQQVASIKSLEDELERMKGINSILPFDDLIFSKKDSDLVKFRIESMTEDLVKMKARLAQETTTATVISPEDDKKLAEIMERGAKTAERFADPLKKLKEQQAQFKEELEKGAISLEVYNRAMKDTQAAYDRTNVKVARKAVSDLNQEQNKALRVQSEYIKLLEIERKQRQDLIAPYQESAKQAASNVDQMEAQIAALKLVKDRQISLAEAVELTTIARLQEKKANASDPGIIKEIESEIVARRKLIDLMPEYNKLQQKNNQVTDSVSQQWIQAGRNIQTALSNSIFDFFNDGLDGMVRSLKSALLRMIAEAASLRLSESIGSVLLGGAGGSGGTGGQTVGLLASLLGAFGGAGGIRTGGGVTTGAFSNAGGAGTAFIGGKGTAIGGSGLGVNATRGAGMGSSLMSMAAMAGPYGMIAAATIMAGMELNKKYGDYKVSGFNKFGMNGLNKTDPIAVIANQFGIKGPGEIIGKALFGRGPYKFRQQSLQGNLSNEGIDGTLTDVFKSKGGVFAGNKHKSFENDLPSEIYRDVNKTLTSIFKSTHEFSKNLGLDASQIDTFTKEIQIKSEKNKALTTEAVGEMLTGFADDVAKLVMPNIESFALTGESASKTFQRLNNELEALKNGVENLGGSVAYASELVNALSIDARSSLVDQAGGIDRLNELTSAFFNGFLSDSEQLGVKSDQLSAALAKLGLSADLTKEQFKALVQSVDTSNEMRIGLLELVPAFLSVRDAQQTLAGTTGSLVDAERSLADIRSELLSAYGKERGELQSTVDKFKNISSTLRDFKNTLTLSQLSPLTPAQKLEEARAQFNRTRALADKGDQGALADLPRVSQEFLQASQTYNASSAAYISDFNLVKSVLDKASTAALTQSEVSQKQLDELKSTVEYLTGIKDEARTTNEILKDLLAATLNSKGNAGISTKDIQDYLQANPNMTAKDIANASIKYGVSKDQLVSAGIKSEAINKYTGGATVSDKDILDFVNSGATPMQIYQAAVANGVTSARLSKVTGISMTDINKFVKDNGLKSFAVGTDFISKSGIVMAHRGEAIVPSSTTEEIKKLREELAKLRQEQNQQTGDMMKITDLSNQRNAKMISDALAQIENRRQWNDKSKVRLA